MADLLVTCIRKRKNRDHPHERIEGIGAGGWFHLENLAIANIESDNHTYHVRVGDRAVKVVVGTHLGRKYLKAETDLYRPDNLLALPECQPAA